MARLIATVLDGTLLRSDGKTVFARTRRALGAARDAGITIVLVSARGPIGMAGVADATGCDDGVALAIERLLGRRDSGDQSSDS